MKPVPAKPVNRFSLLLLLTFTLLFRISFMKKIVLFSVFTLLTVTLYAQKPHFTIGGNLTIANPQGEFENANNNKNIWGGSLEGFAGIGWANVGLNMSFLYRGGETFNRAVSTTLPLNAEVDVTNSMLSLHLVGRLMYPEGMFRPYAEGFAGGNFFSTTTSVKDKNKGDEVISDTNQDDLTGAYGYGGGILFQVWKDSENTMQLLNPGTIFVDLKVRNNFGGNAEYLNSSKDIYYDSNSQTWKTKTSQSKTDYLSWHIGATLIF